MYYKGLGVSKNNAESVKWYRKAAEQDLAVAQFTLGFRYYKGQGVSKDYKEAVKWYRKAAEQGYAKAQLSLGVRYVLGQGVTKDKVRAHMWFDLAASKSKGGTKKSAIKNRGKVTKEMTPNQIAEAQKLAREWMEKHKQR